MPLLSPQVLLLGVIVPTSPVKAAAIAIVLLAVTVAIAGRVATQEGDAFLAPVVVTAMAVRCICSVLQIFVIDHVYHGVADFNRYDGQGVLLAAQFRAGHLGLLGINPIGDGFISIVVGVIYTVIGPDQLGGFLIFTWIALLGLLAFYRAFRIALPGDNHRRYAVLIFLFPSLLFWTSAAGKEALMTLGLGVAAHGAARLLTKRRNGWARLVLGLGFVALVRPHEALLLFAALAVSMAFRERGRRSLLSPFRTVSTIIVILAGGAVLFYFTAGFLKGGLRVNGLSQALNKTHTNTLGSGEGFGSSSSVPWSSNPLLFPRDAYFVLFDPLPFQIHNLTQVLAGGENTALLAILLIFGRLRGLGRAMVSKAYVMMAVLYSLGFLYLFAALGNLGLLDRERTLLFPLLFVPLCLTRDHRQPSDAAAQTSAATVPPDEPAGDWEREPARDWEREPAVAGPWGWRPMDVSSLWRDPARNRQSAERRTAWQR